MPVTSLPSLGAGEGQTTNSEAALPKDALRGERFKQEDLTERAYRTKDTTHP